MNLDMVKLMAYRRYGIYEFLIWWDIVKSCRIWSGIASLCMRELNVRWGERSFREWALCQFLWMECWLWLVTVELDCGGSDHVFHWVQLTILQQAEGQEFQMRSLDGTCSRGNQRVHVVVKVCTWYAFFFTEHLFLRSKLYAFQNVVVYCIHVHRDVPDGKRSPGKSSDLQ